MTQYDAYSIHGFHRTLDADDLPGFCGLDAVDVDGAIEERGYCAAWCDVQPVAIVPHGAELPAVTALWFSGEEE